MVPQRESQGGVDDCQPEDDAPVGDRQVGQALDGDPAGEEHQPAGAHAHHGDGKGLKLATSVQVAAKDLGEGIGQHPHDGNSESEQLALGKQEGVKVDQHAGQVQTHASPLNSGGPFVQGKDAYQCDKDGGKAEHQADGQSREVE